MTCGRLKSPGTAWSQRLWEGVSWPRSLAGHPVSCRLSVPRRCWGFVCPVVAKSHHVKVALDRELPGPRGWLSEPPRSAGSGRMQAVLVFLPSQAWALGKVGGILWLSPWGLHGGRRGTLQGRWSPREAEPEAVPVWGTPGGRASRRSGSVRGWGRASEDRDAEQALGLLTESLASRRPASRVALLPA